MLDTPRDDLADGGRLADARRAIADRRIQLDHDLAAASGREFVAESVAGCVRVTVDGRGTVRAVRVDPRQLGSLTGAELGRQVVEAASAARLASAVEMRRTLAHVLDEDAISRLAPDRRQA